MKIPNREIQERVFGYYTEELPPEGSLKAKAYELLCHASERHIEMMAQTFRRMNRTIEERIVKPSIERTAKLN